MKAALEGLSDEEVFSEILARRGAVLGEAKSVKQAELETLMASKEEVGNDVPDGYFFARAVPREKWDAPWTASIERVVARPPAARSDGPGRLHAVRGGLARHRGRTGDRRPPGGPGTGDHLAAGHREPGRGDLPPVQARRRRGMVAAAGRLAASTAG